MGKSVWTTLFRSRREWARLLQEAERSRDEALRAQARAERELRAQGELLNLVAHEIRTPLTAIKTCMSLLKRSFQGQAVESQNRLAGIVVTSATRLTYLVDNLLENARTESGKLEIFREPVDLDQVVRQVLDEHQGLAQDKTLELAWAPTEAGPAFVSDRRLIEVILGNLVSNAIRYTDRGRVELHAIAGERGCWVEVRDTGRGISPERLERIFEPFAHRAGEPRTPGAGIGLGLSLARRLVEQLEGRIEASSELGQGSVFQVWLPNLAEAVPTGMRPGLSLNPGQKAGQVDEVGAGVF